jgi:hypothetical protein
MTFEARGIEDAPAVPGFGRREHEGGRSSYGAIRVAVAVPVNTITVGFVAGGTG